MLPFPNNNKNRYLISYTIPTIHTNKCYIVLGYELHCKCWKPALIPVFKKHTITRLDSTTKGRHTTHESYISIHPHCYPPHKRNKSQLHVSYSFLLFFLTWMKLKRVSRDKKIIKVWTDTFYFSDLYIGSCAGLVCIFHFWLKIHVPEHILNPSILTSLGLFFFFQRLYK